MYKAILKRMAFFVGKIRWVVWVIFREKMYYNFFIGIIFVYVLIQDIYDRKVLLCRGS